VGIEPVSLQVRIAYLVLKVRGLSRRHGSRAADPMAELRRPASPASSVELYEVEFEFGRPICSDLRTLLETHTEALTQAQ